MELLPVLYIPHFIDLAANTSASYISLITPSRWMTRVGQGITNTWVDKMLQGNHFIKMHDYLNATECFDNVEIKGGINYFFVQA